MKDIRFYSLTTLGGIAFLNPPKLNVVHHNHGIVFNFFRICSHAYRMMMNHQLIYPLFLAYVCFARIRGVGFV
jgi:hypothetical protein